MVELQIVHHKFSCGAQETIGFTPDGALKGEEIVIFTIEDHMILSELKRMRMRFE